MSKPLITIGICGGTGAGKTTLSNKLFELLGGAENVSYLLHDSYYKDLSHLSFEERAKTNFDHPDSLDTDLLVQHIKELKKGNEIQFPTYDFTTHSRTSETVTMKAGKIILVEGILILCYPNLVKQLDVKVFVVRKLSACTTADMTYCTRSNQLQPVYLSTITRTNSPLKRCLWYEAYILMVNQRFSL